MAGQPITRSYLERIEQADISRVLDQIAEGYRISEIAPQIGVSRAFLSTHLNSTSIGREALAVARELAQMKRTHGRTSRMCAPVADGKREQVQGWLMARLSLTHSGAGSEDGGAVAGRASRNHLAALQQIRLARAEPHQHPITPAPAALPYTQPVTTALQGPANTQAAT
jgi:hypothetical protein